MTRSSPPLRLLPDLPHLHRPRDRPAHAVRDHPKHRNLKVQSHFTPIRAELGRKLFCFTLFCVPETNSVPWQRSLCAVGQIFFYVCIYVDVCTYVSNVRDVFIASMLLATCHFTALPEPQALLQPRPAGFLPTPTCKAGLAHQASLECGNKTTTCQTWQLFFWCISYLKNNVSLNLINIWIVRTPFLLPGTGGHSVMGPSKGTLKLHVSATVPFSPCGCTRNLKIRTRYCMDEV